MKLEPGEERGNWLAIEISGKRKESKTGHELAVAGDGRGRKKSGRFDDSVQY